MRAPLILLSLKSPQSLVLRARALTLTKSLYFRSKEAASVKTVIGMEHDVTSVGSTLTHYATGK